VHLLVCYICVNGNEHFSTTTDEEFFDRVTDTLPTGFSFMELIKCLYCLSLTFCWINQCIAYFLILKYFSCWRPEGDRKRHKYVTVSKQEVVVFDWQKIIYFFYLKMIYQLRFLYEYNNLRETSDSNFGVLRKKGIVIFVWVLLQHILGCGET
jgi:hypothetical protein